MDAREGGRKSGKKIVPHFAAVAHVKAHLVDIQQRIEGPSMIKIILIIVAALLLWSSSATAQEGVAVGACVTDIRNLCPGIQPGKNRLRECLREHIQDLSDPCLVTLAKFAEVRKVHKECRAQLDQQCGHIKREDGRFGACLRSAVAGLSDTCKNALARAVSRARLLRRNFLGRRREP
jgi:hypothetical protein